MYRLLPIVMCFACAGCLDPTALQVSGDESAGDKPARPVAADPAEPPPADQPAPPAGAAFPDVEARLVDKQVVMAENPDIRETENGINAMDPISAASQSYFALGSRVHLSAFQYSIRLFDAEHDRLPTFEEFSELLSQSNVEFKGLKPWQMYAYDSSDGTVCILEDLEVKRARYEAAGLDYEEE